MNILNREAEIVKIANEKDSEICQYSKKQFSICTFYVFIGVIKEY